MVVINEELPASEFRNIFPNTQLNPVNFDNQIETLGARVKVYKTVSCPNIKRIDGADHEPNCKLCFNSKFIDRDPVDSWAIFQQQTLIEEFNVEGKWDDQVALASFKVGVYLQTFSKVELIDFTTTFDERIQRQEGSIDRLKYPAYKINFIIDQTGADYTEGSDFRISDAGDVEWIGNHQPQYGFIYSIHYDYPVTFRAVKALHINRFSQTGRAQGKIRPVELPQEWMLKRDYLLTREEIESNPYYENKIIEI